MCHRQKAGRKRCRVGTMSLATSRDIMRSGAEGDSGWRKTSFDRRRCGRETRWQERKRRTDGSQKRKRKTGGNQKRKRKTGGSRKRKGFPLQGALTMLSPAQATTSHLHQGTIQFSTQTGGVVLSLNNDRATDNHQQGGNKRTKCCAVCVWNYCLQQHTCPGTGSRAWCRCHHSRTPPSKEVHNISEPKINVFLLETALLLQNEREDLLAHEKDVRLIGGS